VFQASAKPCIRVFENRRLKIKVDFMEPRRVIVEIVAKQKGCMLCDLAIAILEEIVPEFAPGRLQWVAAFPVHGK
jgi:hypothetical protein